MKYIIIDGVVLSRPLEGPLAAHIGSFARWSSEQGYSLCTLHRRVLVTAQFSRWLGQKRVRLRRISLHHAKQYLRSRRRRSHINRGDAATLRHLIELLRREGVIPPEEVTARRLTAVDRCAKEYEQYLREERLLATATILNYVPFVRCFLKNCFGSGHGQAVAPVRERHHRLCPTAGAPIAPQKSEAADKRVAFLLAIRALSRRSDNGSGGGCSNRGQLVDDITAPSD